MQTENKQEMALAALQEERLRALNPSASVWVEASAGTGKTRLLTDRVLSLLLHGKSPDKILCLTYTTAAAAEMSSRIMERLSRWGSMTDSALQEELTEIVGTKTNLDFLQKARHLFTETLENPIKIQTIHAFCQSILRRFPLEADVPQGFELIDERTAQEILKSCRAEILREDGGAENESIKFLARNTSFDGFLGTLEKITSLRGKIDDLFKNKAQEAVFAEIYAALSIDPSTEKTPDHFLETQCAEEMFKRQALLNAARKMLEQGGKTDQNKAQLILTWLEKNTAAERAKEFPLYKRAFLKDDGDFYATPCTKKISDPNPEIVNVLQDEGTRILNVLDKKNRIALAEATKHILHIAEKLIDKYAAEKRRRRALDYHDLIEAVRHLFLFSGQIDWVMFKLDGGIDHILVDEAQDTSPAQWQIITAISDEFFSGAGATEERRTIFVVGDKKQSIYSFQGANLETFQEVRSYLEAQVTGADQIWERVNLTLSFRSTPAVLESVDALFNHTKAWNGVKETQDESLLHKPYRAGQAGSVEILPVTKVEKGTDGKKKDVNKKLAQELATKIEVMIAGEDRLLSQDRPVQAGDIMILFRRRGRLFHALAHELKIRNIPVSGIDRMVITKELAVMDLMALGEVMLLPEDDLNLAILLKSPLIGLTEAELFEVSCGRDKNKSLWEHLGDGRFRHIKEQLETWRSQALTNTPYHFYTGILDVSEGRKRIIQRLGELARDPLEEFVDLSRHYERKHLPSLQGFLSWMNAAEVEIKREMEQGNPYQVRLMTVHGSKGLQAPIVILPDTMVSSSGGNSRGAGTFLEQDNLLFWMQNKGKMGSSFTTKIAERDAEKDLAERNRLLYVAMTRAEDRLIICGALPSNRKNLTEKDWYQLVLSAFEGGALSDVKSEGEGENKGYNLANPQTDKPKKSSEKQRVMKSDHSLQDVSWMHQKIETHVDAFPEKIRASQAVPIHPLTPSIAQENAMARGTLTHRLLEFLPEIIPTERAQKGGGYLTEYAQNIPEKERVEMLSNVLNLMDNAEYAACFGVGSRAEVSLEGFVDGQKVTGQIDRLLVTDEKVYIIDYKTGHSSPETAADIPPIYINQMRVYKTLVSQLYPEKNISCALLWVEALKIIAI
ncbi:MAG: double-strand break repair helicase AddA [Alphaproteobacteria bacterium]